MLNVHYERIICEIFNVKKFIKICYNKNFKKFLVMCIKYKRIGDVYTKEFASIIYA